MSNRVRVTHSSITLKMIVAMVSFVGLVFADSGSPVKTITPQGAKQVQANPETGVAPAGDSSVGSRNAASLAVTLPLPGDTCANPLPVFLNRITKANSRGDYGVYCSLDNSRSCNVDLDCAATFSQPDAGVCIKTAFAQNDYQTPANATCYSGINNIPSSAPGRDIVYTFTAPAAGKYTFEIIDRNEGNPFQQAFLLYLTDCANSGVVNCIRGVNRSTRNPALAGSSNGFNNNTSEALDCHQMNAGETVYIVYDDLAPGACTNNAHACRFDADCAPGATCTPTLNAGGPTNLEVRPCNPEVEPNDTPASANPYVCGVIGEGHVAPLAHCYLGTRAGNVCTRNVFIDQSVYDANMRCSISGAQCVVDLTTGLGNCVVPGELCQSQTDLDCDPRCDVGPRAGLTCTTQAFCNPVSDQGATCAGSCQIESSCVVDATGVNTGVACTPVCVGGSFPGRYCSGLSGCPGGGVCTQTPVVPAPGATCLTGQTCTRSFNEGDADFYSLGSFPAGSTVFAAVDGSASSDGDWRLRVNNDTQTLQFDDDDGFTRICQSSAVIAGAVTNGGNSYLQVSRTQPRTSANYELYAHVRPPLAQAQLEDESGPLGNDNFYVWPFDLPHINPIDNGANNGYIRGTTAFQQDSDCFKFLVNEGDLMDWFGAANPQRAPVALALISHPQPIIFDAEPAPISNFVFGANARKNTLANVVQPGLKAVTPAVSSEYHQWRAKYTGVVEICYYDASPIIGTGTPTYPVNWSGSLTVNCGPVQAAGPGTTTTDVSVVKTGPIGPVSTGDFIEYTITVKNEGSQIAQEVTIDDTLDPNLTFISLTADDGFGGNNVGCFSLPTPSTNDAPISCLNGAMAPGQTTTYTVTVQVNNCIGDGVVIDNSVSITSVSTDPNPANDSSSAPSFTALAPPGNSCQDIVCNLTPGVNTCVKNLCTVNDTCQAGVCVSGGPPDCDDNSVCTDDSCNPATGCINDDSVVICLDDFNECTANTCDPVLGCNFPPEPTTTPCDDQNACTLHETCDGNGACVGPTVCDDANDCTIDFSDENNSCACAYVPASPGAPCSDNNACTGSAGVPDACNSVASCVGGQPVDCGNDGNACTTDTCDPSLGCVFTPVDCAPPDQCHAEGVCDSGSGNCSYAPLPNGTTCDDGDSGTTGDVCTGGVCAGGSACDTQPTPKAEGYFKKLCKGGVSTPHAGDAITDADAACVGQLTDTFAGITTASQVCAEWGHDSNHDSNGPNSKECEEKAERELMALALNICRGNVCLSQEVDSGCSGHDSHGNHTLTTVQESLDTADDILSDPARNKDVCKDAKCLAKEINNGKGIHHTTLMVSKVAGSPNKVLLTWENPIMDDGSGEASAYSVWRRPLSANSVFVLIKQNTTALTYVDTPPAGAYEYEVTFTIEP